MKLLATVCCLALLLALPAELWAAGTPSSQEEKPDHHTRPREEEMLITDLGTLVLEDFPAEGYILDLGGGGEGVIGQLKGREAISIDISKRELEEAPGDALKIVMDATDLKFLDGTFGTTASFFTLMYIPQDLHPKVFAEAFRVMKPGGVFRIWDAVFDTAPEGKKIAVVRLSIQLPHTLIGTGYGTRFPPERHDLDYYRRLARAAGFEESTARDESDWFYLELKKPAVN